MAASPQGIYLPIRMPSARQLLDQAPPQEIATLHAARMGREGLLQRTRIRTEVEAWLSDPSRLELVLEGRPSARETAIAIHLAGERGIPCSSFDDHAQPDLEHLASEFVIVLEQSDIPCWCPLLDLTSTLLSERMGLQEDRPRPHGQRPAARAFVEGLAALSAGIDLGRARLNRDGSLNRRDRPSLREHFPHLAPLGDVAQDCALDLALQLFSSKGLLRQREGRLETVDGLEQWLRAADDEPDIALRWWESRSPRTRELRAWLTEWTSSGITANVCQELFRRREGDLSPNRPGNAWANLPELLRQALAIGLLDAEIHGASLQHVWPHQDAPPPPSDRAWWCTSDFQLFLAPGAPLVLHRCAAFLGNCESSDLVSRYRIARDTFLAGAAVPSWGPKLPERIVDLAPPQAVAFQLEQWLASRRACLFESVRVLRVADPRRHLELASLDSFTSLVLETIPDWGFVIDASQESALRKLLSSLGYDPPGDPSEVASVAWLAPDLVEPKDEDPPEWGWPRLGGVPRKTIPGSASRYAGGGLKELDFPDCLRLAEYAALTDHEVEIVLKSQPNRVLRLKPLRIDRRKEPATLEATLSSTGERRDIALETIRKIGLVED